MNKLPISEHKIQDAILDLLNYNGYYAFRMNVGANVYEDKSGHKRFVRYGQQGFSDIFAVQRGTGKIICIECKRPETRNRVTEAQQSFLDRINDQGGIGFVATSIEDVANKLRINILL